MIRLESEKKIQAVLAIRFSTAGHLLAAGTSLGDLNIFQAGATWNLARNWRAHNDNINSLAFAEQDRILLSAGWDGRLLGWKTADWTPVPEINTSLPNPIARMAYGASCDTVLLAGSGFRTLQLISPLRSKRPRSIFPHMPSVTRVIIAKDCSVAASSASPGTAMLWDPVTMKQRFILRGPHGFSANLLALSADAKSIATGSGGDRSVILWSTQTGQQIASWSFPNRYPPECLQFLPGSRLVVFAWEGSTAKRITTVFECHMDGSTELLARWVGFWCHCVDLHPDGRIIAMGCSDGFVRLWHLPALPDKAAK